MFSHASRIRRQVHLERVTDSSSSLAGVPAQPAGNDVQDAKLSAPAHDAQSWGRGGPGERPARRQGHHLSSRNGNLTAGRIHEKMRGRGRMKPQPQEQKTARARQLHNK